MRVPPLFNGKVWIGNNYRRPLPNLVESHDAYLWQEVLLNKKNKSIWSFLNRLF